MIELCLISQMVPVFQIEGNTKVDMITLRSFGEAKKTLFFHQPFYFWDLLLKSLISDDIEEKLVRYFCNHKKM